MYEALHYFELGALVNKTQLSRTRGPYVRVDASKAFTCCPNSSWPSSLDRRCTCTTFSLSTLLPYAQHCAHLPICLRLHETEPLPHVPKRLSRCWNSSAIKRNVHDCREGVAILAQKLRKRFHVLRRLGQRHRRCRATGGSVVVRRFSL